MSAFTRFLGRLFGPSPKPKTVRVVRGPSVKYDAAQTGTENHNHWANADSLSARAANNPSVRWYLRNRSRYERANNGNAKGIIRGRTNDTIGTGPRLQIELPEQTTDKDFGVTLTTGTPQNKPADLARTVEKLWCSWAESIRLNQKLRVMTDAEDTDGETFGLLATNSRAEVVQLDLRVIEADRVTTPDLMVETATYVDGIELDTNGNPIVYDVLRQHPGDTFLQGEWSAYDRFPAGQVIHLFEQDRPEQLRGVPILTAGLPLYSILRRYTLATLMSAELSAMIAGIIEDASGASLGSDETAPEIEAMDEVPFARNALLTMPSGKTAKKFDSNTPSGDYGEFKKEVLTEAGRSAGEMQNTATGSSAPYNYSSGRLDHLPRQRGIEIRRERYECEVLDRIFRAWLVEAQAIPGYLPAGLPDVATWEWRWHWDGFPSIDPKKDAEAEEIQKRTGLLTDSAALAARGIDWREHYRQLAAEMALRKELGIEPKPVAPPAPAAAKADPEEEETEDEEETEEEDANA